MMFKVNDIFLDFDGDIELERQVKLFEDISETQGDFSYQAVMSKTSNNLTALGIPVPDSISKIVYTKIPAILYDDQGQELHRGSIRIEGDEDTGIKFSFFSGNSNWITQLVGNMTELRLTQYDVDINGTNIQASWSNTSGIIFPLIDTGTLITRGYSNARSEDFVGCFFIHTLLKEVFQQDGIKIQGELLDDPFFKSLVISTNTRSRTDYVANSFFVGSDTIQSFGALSSADITFEDQTGDFSVGDHITIVGNKDFYVNAKMIVDLEITVFGVLVGVNVMVNGVLRTTGEISFDMDRVVRNVVVPNLKLEAGDYVTIEGQNGTGIPTVITGATFKFTPQFIYKAYGRGCVPLWTKQEFVSNILRIFNTVTSFDQFTGTLTINLFDKIKEKEPIDISEFITVDRVDYAEFVQNYANQNNLVYDEGNSDEDLKEYNISKFLKYGNGSIEMVNEFVDKTVNIVESDFATPISYRNFVFNGSMERINFVEFEEDDSQDITSVTNSGGTPRFNIANADDFFEDNDLVRLDIDGYNGDFVIDAVTTTYITVRGLTFTASATGTATRLFHKVTTDGNNYIFAVTKEHNTTDIFNKSPIYLDYDALTTFVVAYFNMLKLGMTIEDYYKQGLSFGPIQSPFFFQRTLIQSYWVLLGLILQDPVKLLTTSRYPLTVYRSIDFLRPLMIRTLETSNLYFPNRITEFPDGNSETELIKLS